MDQSMSRGPGALSEGQAAIGIRMGRVSGPGGRGGSVRCVERPWRGAAPPGASCGLAGTRWDSLLTIGPVPAAPRRQRARRLARWAASKWIAFVARRREASAPLVPAATPASPSFPSPALSPPPRPPPSPRPPTAGTLRSPNRDSLRASRAAANARAWRHRAAVLLGRSLAVWRERPRRRRAALQRVDAAVGRCARARALAEWREAASELSHRERADSHWRHALTARSLAVWRAFAHGPRGLARAHHHAAVTRRAWAALHAAWVDGCRAAEQERVARRHAWVTTHRRAFHGLWTYFSWRRRRWEMMRRAAGHWRDHRQHAAVAALRRSAAGRRDARALCAHAAAWRARRGARAALAALRGAVEEGRERRRRLRIQRSAADAHARLAALRTAVGAWQRAMAAWAEEEKELNAVAGRHWQRLLLARGGRALRVWSDAAAHSLLLRLASARASAHWQRRARVDALRQWWRALLVARRQTRRTLSVRRWHARRLEGRAFRAWRARHDRHRRRVAQHRRALWFWRRAAQHRAWSAWQQYLGQCRADADRAARAAEWRRRLLCREGCARWLDTALRARWSRLERAAAAESRRAARAVAAASHYGKRWRAKARARARERAEAREQGIGRDAAEIAPLPAVPTGTAAARGPGLGADPAWAADDGVMLRAMRRARAAVGAEDDALHGPRGVGGAATEQLTSLELALRAAEGSEGGEEALLPLWRRGPRAAPRRPLDLLLAASASLVEGTEEGETGEQRGERGTELQETREEGDAGAAGALEPVPPQRQQGDHTSPPASAELDTEHSAQEAGATESGPVAPAPAPAPAPTPAPASEPAPAPAPAPAAPSKQRDGRIAELRAQIMEAAALKQRLAQCHKALSGSAAPTHSLSPGGAGAEADAGAGRSSPASLLASPAGTRVEGHEAPATTRSRLEAQAAHLEAEVRARRPAVESALSELRQLIAQARSQA